MCVCVCERQDERVFYHVVQLSTQSVSLAGPSKVMLGAGMKAISSLSLTKCESEKRLESLLLLSENSAAQLTRPTGPQCFVRVCFTTHGVSESHFISEGFCSKETSLKAVTLFEGSICSQGATYDYI